MQPIQTVEEAKALLTVAKDWPILKWLTEKRRVREIADRGTAALDDYERKVKSTWADNLRNAYAELADPVTAEEDPFAAAEYEYSKQQAAGIPEVIKAAARRVKAADDQATRARLTAEKTFDDAERRLSARLARQGAEEAIAAYDLRYQAIAEAEAAG